MAIVDELVAVLGYKLQGEQNLARFNQGMDRAAGHASKFAGRMKMLGTAALGIGTALGAAATAAGVGLAKTALDVGGSFESLKAQLKVAFEGNTTAAGEAFGKIQQFAKTTPYSLQGVTEAFVRLKNYGIQPFADDTLQILGDTASAMGKPIMQAVEAIADAQTGEFERLKEFGIKARKENGLVTLAWTQDGKAVTKTVRETSEEIRRGIYEIWGPKYRGAMIEQSKTWRGLLSNLGDAWDIFLAKIFDSGLGDFAKSQLKSLLDWIDGNDQAISDTAQKIAETFVNIGKGAAEAVAFTVRHWDQLKIAALSLAGGLAVLAAIVAPIPTAIAAIGAAASAAFVDFAKWKGEQKSPWPEGSFGFEKIDVGFLDYLKTAGESVLNWFAQLPDQIIQVMERLADWFAGIGDRIVEWMGSIDQGQIVSSLFGWIDAIDSESGKFLNKFSAAMNRLGSAILDAAIKIFQAIDWTAVGQAIWDNFLNAMKAGWVAIENWFNEKFNWIKNLFSNLSIDAPKFSSPGGPMNYSGKTIKPNSRTIYPTIAPENTGGANGSWEPELPMNRNDQPSGMGQPRPEPKVDLGQPLSFNPSIDVKPVAIQPPSWWNTMRGMGSRTINNTFGAVTLNQHVAQSVDAPDRAAQATIDAITRQMRDMPTRVAAQIA